MRLRRIEFVVIALTFAFICFMGGYFAGSKSPVNILTVEPQHGETQQVPPVSPPSDVGGAESHVPSEDFAAKNSDSPGVSQESPATATPPADDRAGAPKGGDGKININLASRTELTDLPGIGEVLSGRIVDYRNQHGAFSSIEEIKNVSGIGEKRFEAIRDKITVS